MWTLIILWFLLLIVNTLLVIVSEVISGKRHGTFEIGSVLGGFVDSLHRHSCILLCDFRFNR